MPTLGTDFEHFRSLAGLGSETGSILWICLLSVYFLGIFGLDIDNVFEVHYIFVFSSGFWNLGKIGTNRKNLEKTRKTVENTWKTLRGPPGIPGHSYGIPDWGSRGTTTEFHWVPEAQIPTGYIPGPSEGGIFDPTVLMFEVFPCFLKFFPGFSRFYNREIDFSIKK